MTNPAFRHLSYQRKESDHTPLYEDDDDSHQDFGNMARARGLLASCSSLDKPQFRRILTAITVASVIAAFVALIWATESRRQYQATHGATQSCTGSPFEDLKSSSTVENMQHGVVASDHPLCSELGKDILRDGGNAVDAAVATTLCLGIANPASSGIGGGAFILIHSDVSSHRNKIEHHSYESPDFIDARDDSAGRASNGKVTEVIDCREVAPAASSTDMFLNKTRYASIVGGLAVAVPGELRGLELAHARHGRLPWAEVVQPVVDLARNGVEVTAHLAEDVVEHTDLLWKHGDLKYLLSENNDEKTRLRKGDILKNPKLAESLEAVMVDGADAIYKGSRGRQLANDIQKAGGIITPEDLSSYRARLRSPLVAKDVSGYSLVGVPPPSSGGATLIGIARFLSGYQIPFATFADTLSKHRMVEAMRHMFAIRMSLSDPDYNTNTTLAAVNDMTKGPMVEKLRQATRDNATLPLSKYGGKWAQLHDGEGRNGTAEDAQEGDRRRRLRLEEGQRKLARRFGYLEDHGTSHLSVVDSDGNAVSITSSVNTYFGSGVVSRSTGIVLNNQMDDFGTPGRPNFFGLKPSKANFIKAGKKPLSSMSPIIVFRQNEDEPDPLSLGSLFMVLGASGGPKIITAVVQVFINYAILGLPLYESVVHPRIHDQLLYHESDVTTLEQCPLEQEEGLMIEVDGKTRAALKKRRHRLLDVDYMGTVQAIVIDQESNTLTAVSDIRKGGTPAGY